MLHRGTVALLALATVAACGGKIPPVPATCKPLDATNTAVPPSDMSETIAIVTGSGTSSAGSYFFAQGQGFVHASVDSVWTALQGTDVVADRRQLQSDKISKENPDPNAAWSYILESVTSAANLGFPYFVQWRGYATAGTEQTPTAADVCGNLTQSGQVAGTNVMNILLDSIVITTVNANTTAYAAIRHRGDEFSSTMVCQQYVQDVFNSVVAKVHGNPLPTY